MKTLPEISLVIPCYNEEEALPETAEKLSAKMTGLISGGIISQKSTIVFVDDGSKDDTWNLIQKYQAQNPLFGGIKLSRNRGHQNALLAGLLMVLMDNLLGLTGAVNHEATALLNLPIENPLDLRAIIFAGVIFGAVGAIMDVAMSIASALWEVREAGGVSDFRSLMKSGITIGQDTLGTMLNTLILAYIGSSLSIILLITANTTSFMELFNMEMIIVELLRALIGSFGMLLSIPLTAAICGWLFSTYDDYEDYENYEDYESNNDFDDDYFKEIRLKQEQRTIRKGE